MLVQDLQNDTKHLQHTTMEKDGLPPLSLPVYSLPCLARVYSRNAFHRPVSNASLDSAIRQDALYLYRREELPSIYHNTYFENTDAGISNASFDKGRPKKAPHIVDWDHHLDPDKPLNWPAWKKGLNIGCIFLMCIIS